MRGEGLAFLSDFAMCENDLGVWEGGGRDSSGKGLTSSLSDSGCHQGLHTRWVTSPTPRDWETAAFQEKSHMSMG